jgi:glycosyltransferase involved in cell wall biosynthesis
MGLKEQLADYAGGDEHALVDDFEQPLPGEARKPTEQELKQAVAAPGRKAMVPLGIMYQGPWTILEDGMCRHVREQSRALAMHAPVNLTAVGPIPLLDHENDAEVLATSGYLQNVHCSRYACAIRQLVFLTPEYLRNVVCPGGGRLSGPEDEERVWQGTIVYTSWERDRVAQHFVEDLSKLGEVWVPCEANRVAFISSGVPAAKVRVIPYPYDPATHLTTQIPSPRGSEEVPRGRRFYTIGKWEPRKGQHELIGAFLQAFTPKDRACLTIKTFGWGNWKGYLTPKESARYWISQPSVKQGGWTPKMFDRLIRFIDAKLTDAEIAELHAKNNIYVSASHGEAWDIPAFDARCAGNSLVYVGYGGSEDYTRDDNKHFVRVPYSMGPVHAGYGWEAGAQWGDYTVADLASALRKARPPERRIHPEDFAGRFSRHVVGRKMKEAITSMLEARDPQLAGELRHAGGFG